MNTNEKINLLKDFVLFLKKDKEITEKDINRYITNTTNATNAKNLKDPLIIFTDGACSCNGKNQAKGGIGIFIENTKTEISKTIEKVVEDFEDLEISKPTNNIAELLAIYHALKINKNSFDTRKIIIKSDSNYSINSITKWYKNWQSNGWKTASGKPVLNKEIIQKILKYSKHSNISFKHVMAHKNKPLCTTDEKYLEWYGNFKADELATLAVKNN